MVEAGLPCCTVTPPIVFGCVVGRALVGATGEPEQSVGSTDDGAVEMPLLTAALLGKEPKHGDGERLGGGSVDGGGGGVVKPPDGGVSAVVAADGTAVEGSDEGDAEGSAADGGVDSVDVGDVVSDDGSGDVGAAGSVVGDDGVSDGGARTGGASGARTAGPDEGTGV
jgi:hypothetical protein